MIKDVLLTIGVMLLYMMIFRLVGTGVLTALGQRKLYIHREIVGFFVYMGIFQVIYLPMVLLKAPFHLLAGGWIIANVIMVLGCAVYLVTLGPDHPFAMPKSKKPAEVYERALKFLVLIGTALFLVFLVLQQYLGWDTAFYMGNMQETLYTDTMYLYSGNDGTMMKSMDLRYALSGFSIQFTVPCFYLGISPVIMCYYGIRGLGALIALLIVFDFGMLLFEEHATHAYLLVAAYLIVNMALFSHSATSLFFIRRMNEAKGYCANVVLPFVALLLLLIYGKKAKNLWGLLFIISLCSVAVSMSSMMLVPALLGIGSVVTAIKERKLSPVFLAILCSLPNLFYAGIYVLDEIDIISISTGR